MLKFIFNKFSLSSYIFLSLILNSCNDGLSPDMSSGESGFSGTITFIGEWPPDIHRTFLVVFDSLLIEQNDFNPLNLKFVSQEIPFGVQQYRYSSTDSAFIQIDPGVYEYVAVIQSRSEMLTFNRIDWFVAGIYYANGDIINPGTLLIPENNMVSGINIDVDFNNPPPQPPGGIEENLKIKKFKD